MNKKAIAIIVLILAVAAGAGVWLSPTIRTAISDLGSSGKEMLSIPLRGNDSAAEPSLTRQGVIADTNNERAKQGLPLYEENSSLDQAAEQKLNDMFDRQYFEHVSPDGNGPSYLAKQVGYSYLVVGENLALGNFADDAALVAAWMASPGHKANILSDRFVDIGVAVGQGTYQGKTVWMAVQEFGKPASACPAISAALKAKIDGETESVDALNSQIADEKTDLAQMPQSSETEREAYNKKVSEYNDMVKKYNAALASLKKDIDAYNEQVRAFNACLKS